MNNYIEYGDKIAFHPGYYIKEIIEQSGLTQEDFAKRLATTPKNISKLVNGEQNLSRDMALKLSRMLGTSVDYWLNFQKKYDSLLAEFDSAKELEAEREVFKFIDYEYFRSNFGLPYCASPDEQIRLVREFLNIASLTVLANKDFVDASDALHNQKDISRVINSNIMIQIAINKALQVEAERFNRRKFAKAAEYVLSLADADSDPFPQIKQSFQDAGVIFVMLPALQDSGINCATKKIKNNIMLMMNDQKLSPDTFWLTLSHEVKSIINEGA